MNMARKKWDPKSRGVVLFRKTSYHARVYFEGRSCHVGAWPTEKQAAIARDRAVLYFDLKLPLNYPEESGALGPARPSDLIREGRVVGKRRRRNQSRFIGVWKNEYGGWEAD